MRIGLMADIPNELVLRSVEHVMQGHRKLDGSQARAQVPPGLRDDLNQKFTDVGAEDLEVGLRELAHILGKIDVVQDLILMFHDTTNPLF